MMVSYEAGLQSSMAIWKSSVEAETDGVEGALGDQGVPVAGADQWALQSQHQGRVAVHVCLGSAQTYVLWIREQDETK